MEEIIGLLIIVATFIFKVVGKKLENAGQAAETVLEVEKEPLPSPSVPEYTENVTRQVAPAKPAAPKKPAATHKPAAPKSVARKPILNEPVRTKKEKIDLKKMIIYSEIMSPKYNEK
jgi:hypothetical protein